MSTLTKILLVDDDLFDRETFISALSSVDNAELYDVAKNGKEALAILQRSLVLPSVIFMDVEMPLMGGIECLEDILQNPKTKDIPVVMLTSTERFRKTSGARRHIVKPDDERTLAEGIRKAIEDFC